jgi:hypothetical protein
MDQIVATSQVREQSKGLWKYRNIADLREGEYRMSDKAQNITPYPEPPAKKRNDLAIELIAGSVGGATQVLIGQVSPLGTLQRSQTDT